MFSIDLDMIDPGNTYPKVFGTKPETAIAECMDAARGGHFTKISKCRTKTIGE